MQDPSMVPAQHYQTNFAQSQSTIPFAKNKQEEPLYPNTQYYLQHGSEVLNKSLRG